MLRMRIAVLFGALVMASVGCGDDDDDDRADVPQDTILDTQLPDAADVQDVPDAQDATDETTGDAQDALDAADGTPMDAVDATDGTTGDAVDADAVPGDAVGPGDVPAGTQVLPGSQARFLDQQVASWVLVDASNTVLAIGASVPRAAFQSAPTSGEPPAPVQLILPGEVANTFVNHISLDWNPAGHEPALYQVPHLDLHFYGASIAEVAAVDCTDVTLPTTDRVPEGYAVAPANQCVPAMGIHAVPVSDTTRPRTTPWEKTLVLGYYGGELTFIEPMLSQQILLGQDTIELDVPKPQTLGRSTRYPTKFRATYDRNQEAWIFLLSDFETAQ